MSNSEAPNSPASPQPAPVIDVGLQVDRDVHAALEKAGSIARIESSIGVALDDLCDSLGVPGRVDVRIAPAPAGHSDEDRFFRLEVGGRRASYCTVTLQNLRHLLDPDRLLAAEGEGIKRWLLAGVDSVATRYLQLVCLQVASENASLLFGPAQFERYSADLLGQRAAAEALAGSDEVLRDLLRLGISLRDTVTIAQEFTTSSASLARSRENLISQLTRNTIEIRMPEDYLEELTSGTDGWAEEFKALDEAIFAERGVHRPGFAFAIDEGMNPRSFQFKVNDVYTAPLAGLGPEERLVNDSASRVRLMGFDARPANHPTTGVPYAIVDMAHQIELDAAGLTTWNAKGYLELCMAEVVRRKGYCLISNGQSKELLDSLRIQYPDIGDYVSDLVPTETITEIVRELAADGVSVRNLRKVCECISDARSDPDPIASVRVGIARELTHQISRSQGVALVYLLDKPILDILSSEDLADDSADRVLEAIRGELRQLPAIANPPALLAPPTVRRRLRALTSIEFPNMPVVTYGELALDFSVQPVARISC